MKKVFIFVFMLVSGTCFAQDLEEKIYLATETFHLNQTNEGLLELNKSSSQFEKQLNSKDDYYAFINLLVNKAYYLEKTNKQSDAINSYEKAHQLYINHKITSYDIIEYCLIPLGILYHKTNAYIKAEQLITHYIQLAEKQNNTQQQISGYINLAKLYESLNRHQDVFTFAYKGLKIEGIKKPQEQNLKYIIKRSEWLLESNQKRLLLDGDLVAPKFHPKNAEEFQLNYEIALKNEDYDLAFSNLNRLKQIKINELTSARIKSKFSFQEAQLHYKRDENDKAISKLKKSLANLLPNYDGSQFPENTYLYPENTFIDIFDLWAEMQTDPEKALQYYNLSFYVAELLAKENTNQESYILNASINKARSEKCIALLYDLFAVKGESTYASRAFEYAEGNKALALKWYSNKRTLLEKHPTDPLLIREQQLLKRQQQFTNRLLNRAINKSQQQEQDSLRLQLISTSTELKQLQDSIRKTYASEQKFDLNLNQLTSKLKKENTCLVEYFYGKNGLYQFVFTAEHFDFQFIELTESNQKDISKFINYFENASTINTNISEFTKDAFQLYELLKLKDISTFKNVIIVADGLLNFIPFESLLTKPTSTSMYSEMPFLVKNHALAYHTSASFYVNTKPYKFKNNALGVFPVFDNTNLKLSYSLDEAERLDNEIKTDFLMYNSATKKDVLNQANNYSILHLSTHANSGDFISAANIDFIDSKLYLQELYNLDLKNDLVVLSACETGIGVLQKGEGSMNLARGFKYAGVSNMLVSLWNINDLSTSQVMSSFYSELRTTESAFIANRNSKLAYLNSDDVSNVKKSPYYWSAFVYFGDLSPPKSSNHYNILIYSIIGLVIAGLFWLLIFKRNRWKR